MRGNLDMKQHHERNMSRAFDTAWDMLKSYEIDRSVSRREADHMAGTDYGQGRKALSDEAAGKANDFHTARREAMRPHRNRATVADPSEYRQMRPSPFSLGSRVPFDLSGPKTNPFPGGEPTIQEMMARAEEEERLQGSVSDIVSNYEPEHMSTSETNQPLDMGSTVRPPKSAMSPQGNHSPLQTSPMSPRGSVRGMG